MTKNNYLSKLAQRELKVKNQEIFLWGLMLGLIFILLGSFNYFFVTNNTPYLDTGWLILIGLGSCSLLITFIQPQRLTIIQNPIKNTSTWLSKKVLEIILIILYVFIVTPLGLVFQKIDCAHQFCSWKDHAPRKNPAWEKQKAIPYQQTQKSMLFYPFYIVYFMIENKTFIIIPLIFILLFIAMLFFFIQTPVIAPFVYTIF